MNDLHRKMGVHVVILTAHVNEKDQASVSKYLPNSFQMLNLY
jgi:hypothetical protein